MIVGIIGYSVYWSKTVILVSKEKIVPQEEEKPQEEVKPQEEGKPQEEQRLTGLEECVEIDNKYERAECYKKVAKDKQDLTICERITKEIDPYLEFEVDECYIEVAVSKKDETICAKCWDRNTCYERVAKIKEDPNICSGIVGDDQDDCYVDVAIIKQDSLICERVQDQVYKSWCIKTIQKQPLTPEEVVTGFFNWYLKEGSAFKIKDRTDVTQDYKQRIAKTIESQVMVDPVIFAQDKPEGFEIGQATIQDKNAFLEIRTIWQCGALGHLLKVDLILEDNQWKIDKITYLERDVTWKAYQNDNYGYKINYRDVWFLFKDKPESVILSYCSTGDETYLRSMGLSIDILSDTGGGNLNNIEEVKLLKSSGWNWKYATVSDIKAIKLVKPCPTVMGACTAPELTRYYIIKGNYTYRIEFNTGYAKCMTCDEMLSTFQFLE